jgi:hypothetical protein
MEEVKDVFNENHKPLKKISETIHTHGLVESPL